MRVRLGAFLVSGILLLSVALSALTQLDNHLSPFIPQDRYERIVALARYVASNGWDEPILLSYDAPGIVYWSLDRSYFGIHAGRHFMYYGKLQELYFLAPPLNESSYRWAPDKERITAEQNLYEITRRFGSDLAAIRDRAVVFIAPDSYSRPISEEFAAPFARGDGTYVIPPGAMTDSALNRWRLYAASDFTGSNAGRFEPTSWSTAPRVLVLNETHPSAVYRTFFRFGSTVPTVYEVRLRILDLPQPFTAGRSIAPLLVFVDGTPLLTHSHTGAGPLWASATTAPLHAGFHEIEIRVDGENQAVAFAIDTIELVPA